MKKFKEQIQRANHIGISKYPIVKKKKKEDYNIEAKYLKTHESTMSMGSSNFIRGSVNRGPMTKVASAGKILRDPSGYLILKDPRERDLGALKDVISHQQYKLDSLLNAERDLVDELENREQLIQILQHENSKHIQEKNELKEKNRLALNDVATLAKKVVDLEEQLK